MSDYHSNFCRTTLVATRYTSVLEINIFIQHIHTVFSHSFKQSLHENGVTGGPKRGWTFFFKKLTFLYNVRTIRYSPNYHHMWSKNLNQLIVWIDQSLTNQSINQQSINGNQIKCPKNEFLSTRDSSNTKIK